MSTGRPRSDDSEIVLPSARRSSANDGGVAPWSGTRFNAPASSSTVAPAAGAAARSVSPSAMASVRIISRAQDRLGQQRRHHDVGQIDNIADPKVDGHAADDVRLLTRESPILKQAHHGEDGIAAREVEVLALIDSLIGHRHAHGGDEALGRGVSRIDEVAAALESRPANPVTLGLASANTESHDAGGRHLDRSDAHLTVALREVAVAGGKQRALDRDRKQQLAALGELLDVEVPAVFARRQRT